MTSTRIDVYQGDSREILRVLGDASVDSVVTDPPYALVSIGKRFGADGAAPPRGDGAYQRASAGFMGQRWDTGETAFAVEFWAEVWRVLKPGGHVIAFSGTRTYHRLACAVEDAGFEIRDMVAWLYGSGFPKSHDVGKSIDRWLGEERTEVLAQGAPVKRMIPGADQHKAGWEKTDGRTYTPTTMAAASPEAAAWDGWGSALKPALEPCVLARKPLAGTLARNVLAYGTGGLNIDACRVGEALRSRSTGQRISDNTSMAGGNYAREIVGEVEGRWPANLVHDGSSEVLDAFPAEAGAFAPVRGSEPSSAHRNVYGARERVATQHHGDSGSAARFFYSAKADAEDRLGSEHPTVKPVDLMAWLMRLITPPGGTVLDPFAGTGTTGLAALTEGRDAILIEREENHAEDIRRRIAWARGEGALTSQEVNRRKLARDPGAAEGADLPLFATQTPGEPAASSQQHAATASSTGNSLGTADRAGRDEAVSR